MLAIRPGLPAAARNPAAFAPADAARALAWDGPGNPGDWQPVRRTFRDGHRETWRVAEAAVGQWGPDEPARLAVATTDPATQPRNATSCLVTNLPRPGGPRAAGSPHSPAGLAEVTRIYGLRNWAEQGYKQVKDQPRLGRLPGPLRHRHPPPPGAGPLRVQLLLERLARRPPAAR